MGHALELRDSGLVTATGIVASGAVLEGEAYCLERDIDPATLNPSDLARRGTYRQMEYWQRAGDKHGVEVTQVLATNQEIDDSREGAILKRALRHDLFSGAVPIINENPVTGLDEMTQFSLGQKEKRKDGIDAEPDNDWFAAHIGIALQARYLIVLSTMDGFQRLDGSVIEEVSVGKIQELLEVHSQGGNGRGTGGIDSKMKAMAYAVSSGKVEQVIVGNAAHSPLDMIEDRVVHTRVVQ
jgi:glutamate 5-kinase